MSSFEFLSTKTHFNPETNSTVNSEIWPIVPQCIMQEDNHIVNVKKTSLSI